MKIKQPKQWKPVAKKIIEAVVGFEEWAKKSKERFNKYNGR